jgi:hypothetical protein
LPRDGDYERKNNAKEITMMAHNMTEQDLQSIEIAQRLKRQGWPDGLILGELSEHCSRDGAKEIVAKMNLECHATKVFEQVRERLRSKQVS